MECSRPPLDLEIHHVEASTPRARPFRRVLSGLLSLRRVFRGLCSPEYEVSLHGAEVTSSTQSIARLVQLWSSCRPVPPQLHRAEASGQRAMLCGSSGMLFHSLEPFDLPSSWGSRLTSPVLAFGMAYEARGLHLSAFGRTLPGVWFPLKLPLELTP